jgi:putative ABC transport system permease protein
MAAIQQSARELRYAWRQLRRAPGFAFTTVLTLALGMGATTAVFSVVEQMLLTSLPYRDAGRIVALDTFFTDVQHDHPRLPGDDYQDLRSSGAFQETAYYDGGEMGVQLLDHATFTQVEQVSPGFLDVFGVRPSAGAGFRGEDARHQAFVSTAFANAELGGTMAAVGKLLRVESESYEVAGVLPQGFDFPQKTNVWLGGPQTPNSLSRDAYNYHAVARICPDRSLQQTQAQLDTLSVRLARDYPQSHTHVRLTAVPLLDALTGSVRTSLWLWLAAVSVLLLIACANVAHLQLVRFSSREQALAVRSALGASRARIVSSLLTEAALVSLLGGAFGLLLAVPATALLVRLLATQLPRAMNATPDLRLLGFSVVLSSLVTIISAAWPCWWAARRDPAAALHRGTRTSGADRKTAVLRRGLLAFEIALSFLLVVTSSLLVRTIEHLRATPLGFAADNRLVVYAHAPAHGLEESLRRITQLEHLTDELRAIPGVRAAAQTVGLPAGEFGSNGSFAVVSRGESMSQAGLPHANFSLASPGYFRAMGIPLLRGREISASDRLNASPVVLISASLAQQVFRGMDPLGQQIVCGWDIISMNPMTIVGVVGDVRQDSPAEEPIPGLYMPLAQHPFLANEVQIVLHTGVSPATLIPAVRQRVQATDTSIATRFTTMDDALANSTQPQQLRGELLTAFAALALLLAAVGVYGVSSYTVAQQVREIGIRMALGADRDTVARQFMTAAARSGVAGVAFGAILSFAGARLLQRFLVGVAVTDPLSYSIAAAVLLAAVAFAALLPARRAASVDPVVALRTE